MVFGRSSTSVVTEFAQPDLIEVYRRNNILWSRDARGNDPEAQLKNTLIFGSRFRGRRILPANGRLC